VGIEDDSGRKLSNAASFPLSVRTMSIRPWPNLPPNSEF
jgi:hypothetical protein